jgi:GAF domain-containing protein
MAMPLVLRDTVIGVLQIMDKHDGTPFSVADTATLGLFAQLAAVAIAPHFELGSADASAPERPGPARCPGDAGKSVHG